MANVLQYTKRDQSGPTTICGNLLRCVGVCDKSRRIGFNATCKFEFFEQVVLKGWRATLIESHPKNKAAADARLKYNISNGRGLRAHQKWNSMVLY